MTAQRLVRTGVAHPMDNGCTSVEVRVPCTGCRTGCWGARRSPERIRSVELGGFTQGETVSLSLSASGFNTVCGQLFGPAIVAVIGIGLALDGVVGAQSGIGLEVPMGLLALLAMVPGLWLGRWLARMRLSSLDLRLLPGSGTDAD